SSTETRNHFRRGPLDARLIEKLLEVLASRLRKSIAPELDQRGDNRLSILHVEAPRSRIRPVLDPYLRIYALQAVLDGRERRVLLILSGSNRNIANSILQQTYRPNKEAAQRREGLALDDATLQRLRQRTQVILHLPKPEAPDLTLVPQDLKAGYRHVAQDDRMRFFGSFAQQSIGLHLHHRRPTLFEKRQQALPIAIPLGGICLLKDLVKPALPSSVLQLTINGQEECHRSRRPR